MDKKHLKALCEAMTARDAVLAVLHNDASYAEGKHFNHRPVSLETLQGYNSSITRMTLRRLIAEERIKALGNGYILYRSRNPVSQEWELVHVGSVSL